MNKIYPNFYGYCYCGTLLIKKPLGIECPKHKDNFHAQEVKIKLGHWSGPSRSINAFNDYKD